MLIASLPAHQLDLFIGEQMPISRIQLNKRLVLLEEQDKVDLAHVEHLQKWSQHTNVLDSEFIQKTEKTLALIENDFVKQSLLWRLELRTIMSALRKRQQGQSCPEDKNSLGFGKWPYFINKNWQQPDFGIGKQLPWVIEVDRFMRQGDTLGLENFLLKLIWNHYATLGNPHYFNFEAVVIYVLRWDVIRRRASYDKDKAQLRFDELVQSGLKAIDIQTQH